VASPVTPEQGLRVQGLDKTPASDDLRQAGLVQHKSVTTLAQALRPPRIVFLYLPAGTLIDDMLRSCQGFSRRVTSSPTAGILIGETPSAPTHE
jgi:6-phosphogluconate dehydrogenase (decarboxylating)